MCWSRIESIPLIYISEHKLAVPLSLHLLPKHFLIWLGCDLPHRFMELQHLFFSSRRKWGHGQGCFLAIDTMWSSVSLPCFPHMGGLSLLTLRLEQALPPLSCFLFGIWLQHREKHSASPAPPDSPTQIRVGLQRCPWSLSVTVISSIAGKDSYQRDGIITTSLNFWQEDQIWVMALGPRHPNSHT